MSANLLTHLRGLLWGAFVICLALWGSYPVHIVYSLVGLASIDSVYWLIRDFNGRWAIPAICVLR